MHVIAPGGSIWVQGTLKTSKMNSVTQETPKRTSILHIQKISSHRHILGATIMNVQMNHYPNRIL